MARARGMGAPFWFANPRGIPHTYGNENAVPKILDGEIPSKIVYKDDVCAAINDINPQAPVHVLLFPAKPIPRIAEAGEEDAEILARLMLAVPKVAENAGSKTGSGW